MTLDLPEELRASAGGPRALDHALHVYARPLHPELVPLARSRQVEGAAWRARVGLLRDTGHFVEVRRDGAGTLVEVVAPVALDLPASGRLELRRVGASPSGLVDDDTSVPYVASWSYEQRGQDEYAALHARVLAGAARGERLVVRRGHPENDGPAPFSLLDLLLDPKSGRLETFVVHAFPADRAFLFVQSVFGP